MFVQDLMAWYAQRKVDLPWRASTDPYPVWLSEVMLQQTQVATVIPYFERFLENFPTVHDLANADRDTVLKLWEGLGYYNRARNLHQAAQMVAQEYDGVFPTTADDLQNLPGVGRYTAGAIASIAYGEAAPVLDGNVIRVFSRLFNIEEDVTQSTVKNKLWEIAEKWVPDENPGDYNQALMELGRLVCRPKNPDCAACPIQARCAAYALGVQAERPIKRKKAPTPHYDVTAGLIRNPTGQLLITKRPDNKLLGGLWEFPGGKQEPDESLPDCLARELKEELAIDVSVGEFFIQVRHAYTHFKITLHVFECTYDGVAPTCIDCADFKWVTEAELDDFAFSAADRQVIAALRDRPQMLL